MSCQTQDVDREMEDDVLDRGEFSVQVGDLSAKLRFLDESDDQAILEVKKMMIIGYTNASMG